MTELTPEEQAALRVEGRRIVRYLTGREATEGAISRYLDGNRRLLSGPHPETDRALASFARRHPAWIGPLDAASALLRPHNLLRSKILLMVALLETEPDFSDLYLSEGVSATGFFIGIIGNGIAAVLKLMLGCFIFPFAARSR